MLKEDDQIPDTPFPADANVRVSITGLAYSRLIIGQSEINFLRHVEYHKVSMEIAQKRRNSIAPPTFYYKSDIAPGNTIAVQAGSVEPPQTIYAPNGPYPLTEIMNLESMHRKPGYPGLQFKSIPDKRIPITLYLYNCAFYTEKMSDDRYEISESGVSEPGEPVTKKIGYVLGGKMKFRDLNGRFQAEIKGPSPLKVDLPMSDAGGEYIYEVVFDNHCTNHDECEELVEYDSDFRFYYDMFKDKTKSNRKYKLRDPVIHTADVSACNPVVYDPPW